MFGIYHNLNKDICRISQLVSIIACIKFVLMAITKYFMSCLQLVYRVTAQDEIQGFLNIHSTHHARMVSLKRKCV